MFAKLQISGWMEGWAIGIGYDWRHVGHTAEEDEGGDGAQPEAARIHTKIAAILVMVLNQRQHGSHGTRKRGTVVPRHAESKLLLSIVRAMWVTRVLEILLCG